MGSIRKCGIYFNRIVKAEQTTEITLSHLLEIMRLFNITTKASNIFEKDAESLRCFRFMVFLWIQRVEMTGQNCHGEGNVIKIGH